MARVRPVVVRKSSLTLSVIFQYRRAHKRVGRHVRVQALQVVRVRHLLKDIDAVTGLSRDDARDFVALFGGTVAEHVVDFRLVFRVDFVG